MGIAVLGAGVMGTAIALALERAGNEVSICATDFDAHIIEAIATTGIHPGMNQAVPPTVRIVSPERWEEGVTGCDIVVVAVASAGVGSVVRRASSWLDRASVLVVASKGWEPSTGRPLSQVVAGESPNTSVVVVAGPTLAAELAGGTPTGLVCASVDRSAAELVASRIRSTSVRAYVTTDVAGVEVGAALKNVLAIAIGMCDGIAEAKGRPMTNTKAALFSRGLVEMSRMAGAMGGLPETVMGLSGAGDLFVTVLGGRNGRFGRLVGAGVSPELAFEEMGTTVEGYENTHLAMKLADRLSLDLPVVRMVHRVLFEGEAPEDGVRALVLGEVEQEI